MDERAAVLLAALLHDIGKFAQRAGERLTAADRRIETDCCPQWKGRYTHTHVLHSGKWIRERLGEPFSLAEILALYHHAPEACTQSRLAKIITLADRLSSGEREPRPEEESAGKVGEIPLTCLFTKLAGENGESSDFPMLALAPDLRPWFVDAGGKTNYKPLWEGFNQEIDNLSTTSEFDVLIQQVMALLEKYTLFMPSAAYRDRPDISLYHHLKTTAAIAACLFDLEKTESALDELILCMKPSRPQTSTLKQKDFLLVTADISGIQDFIYSVTSAQALKGLKGRSLYIELLGKGVAQQILGTLKLPMANLLFQGGGHFYILAPNTEAANTAISTWQNRVNQVLIQAHHGRLALVLHGENVAYSDFLRAEAGDTERTGGFAKVWREAGAGLSRGKRRKFASSLSHQDTMWQIFGPFPASGEEAACEVCSEELTTGSEAMCPRCESFAHMARDIAKARFLEMVITPPPLSSGALESFRDVWQALGIDCRFIASESPPRPENAWILNNTGLMTKKGPCRGFTFLARSAPRHDNGSIKTLEEIAKAATGIRKWGVLRADVDNLGEVFTSRLGSEDRTLSRLSTLSSLLSLFFSAHVEHLVASPEYSHAVYLVYSGGDDVCLLAPWSLLPDLAKRLQEDFSLWTRGRLTLSAGVYLAPRDKFPVYRAADEAGSLVLLAKKGIKNRLAVFNRAVRWEELPILEDIKAILVKLLRDHEAPRALLGMIMGSWSHYQETQQTHEGTQVPMFRVWRLLYGLRRLAERLGRKESAIGDLMALEEKLIVNFQLRNHTDIAVRWADYLTRKEG